MKPIIALCMIISTLRGCPVRQPPYDPQKPPISDPQEDCSQKDCPS